MKQSNQTISLEEIFNQTLKLWEEGKSLKEILDIFPEHQKEIQELFSMAEIIKKEKSGIIPSKELLNKIHKN